MQPNELKTFKLYAANLQMRGHSIFLSQEKGFVTISKLWELFSLSRNVYTTVQYINGGERSADGARDEKRREKRAVQSQPKFRGVHVYTEGSCSLVMCRGSCLR